MAKWISQSLKFLKKLKKKRLFGFTLIEMVLVISIVSIVTAVGASSYINSTRIARDNRRKTDLETVRQALELYKADNGEYPDAASWTELGNILLPYLKADYFPHDPRSNYEYYYSRDVVNPRKYEICSYLEKLGAAVPADLPSPSTSMMPSASYHLPSPSPFPTPSGGPSPTSSPSPVLSPSPFPSSSPINLTFYAVDDAYLENSTRFNNADLRVEHSASRTRTSYLKFNVSGFSQPSQARLILKNTDTGMRNGTYKLSLGSHSSWTEVSLSTSNAPSPTTLLATYSGTVTAGREIIFDVSSAVTNVGTYTFILHMDLAAGNDLKFSSDEGSFRPKLEISAVLGAFTGKICGSVECNYCLTSP